MTKQVRWVLVAAVVGLLVGCGTGAPGKAGSDPSGPAGATLTITREGGSPVSIDVEVADTDGERAHGLMGVASLPDDEGMAFVWDEPVSTTFWMKDTVIPLSIAFWDADGRIVTILDMEPCREGPCPVYTADAPFIGAVEVNRGWFSERGITVGDRVALQEPGDA